jgi:hypothetical protein
MRHLGGPILVITILAGGCWADFPDSRFSAEQGAADLAIHDLPQQPDAPQKDLPVTELGTDAPVLDKAATLDAGADLIVLDITPTPDLGACPAACSSCKAPGVCVLPCANGCTCPSGWSCEVSCAANGCQGPIDCSGGVGCVVDCPFGACSGSITCGSGTCTIGCLDTSCTAPITCGAGRCDVTCGKKTCSGGVSCAASCACSVDCHATACTGGVTCPASCAAGCGPADGCDNC